MSSGVKPHECQTCGKTFSRKMLLKQHQRVHTGERPYSCPECGKSFADRSNMSLHARLHTGTLLFFNTQLTIFNIIRIHKIHFLMVRTIS